MRDIPPTTAEAFRGRPGSNRTRDSRATRRFGMRLDWALTEQQWALHLGFSGSPNSLTPLF